MKEMWSQTEKQMKKTISFKKEEPRIPLYATKPSTLQLEGLSI